MATIILYGKPGCCLCDDALEILHRIQNDIPFELIDVDITTDPELMARYGERIPVTAVNGYDRLDFAVNEQYIRSLLLQEK